jgi:hypothetical protein
MTQGLFSSLDDTRGSAHNELEKISVGTILFYKLYNIRRQGLRNGGRRPNLNAFIIGESKLMNANLGVRI